MRTLGTILLLIVIVYAIVYYKTYKFKEKHTELQVKYNYVPYSVFDQISHVNLKDLMAGVFNDKINTELYGDK